MDLRTKMRDGAESSETREYLEEKIRAVEKILGDDALVARCEVEVGRDAGRPRHGEYVWYAEINIRIPGNDSFRATNRASTANAAIDDAQAEILHQLRRSKRLHVRLLRRTGGMVKRLMRIPE